MKYDVKRAMMKSSLGLSTRESLAFGLRIPHSVPRHSFFVVRISNARIHGKTQIKTDNNTHSSWNTSAVPMFMFQFYNTGYHSHEAAALVVHCTNDESFFIIMRPP